MPFTATDLANVDAAIASGELSVEVEGKRVQYRSITELLDARKTILGELSTTVGIASRRGTYSVRFTTARGE